MCCTRLAENTGCKNYAKIAICAPSHNFVGLYIFATKACINNRKNLLNSNISYACPHNIVNVGPLTSEMGWRVLGTSANFNGFRVLLRYCTVVAQRISTTLCTTFGRLLGCYTIYIFGGACPLTEFCQVQNSLCVQVLRYHMLAALLHGTRAVGVSQTLRQGGHPVRHWAVELSTWTYFCMFSVRCCITQLETGNRVTVSTMWVGSGRFTGQCVTSVGLTQFLDRKCQHRYGGSQQPEQYFLSVVELDILPHISSECFVAV